MNIVLTGMRGTGKSTIGRLLAKELGQEFVEMDQVIESRAGKTISEIVASDGWETFRDFEYVLSQELGEQDDLVISTGGGTMIFDRNVEVLKPSAKVVLLICSLEVSAERIAGDPGRPSLLGQKSAVDELAEVWKQRQDKYLVVADIVYETDNGKTIEEQVDDIIDSVGGDVD